VTLTEILPVPFPIIQLRVCRARRLHGWAVGADCWDVHRWCARHLIRPFMRASIEAQARVQYFWCLWAVSGRPDETLLTSIGDQGAEKVSDYIFASRAPASASVVRLAGRGMPGTWRVQQVSDHSGILAEWDC
jgi:hypothetical protein